MSDIEARISAVFVAYRRSLAGFAFDVAAIVADDDDLGAVVGMSLAAVFSVVDAAFGSALAAASKADLDCRRDVFLNRLDRQPAPDFVASWSNFLVDELAEHLGEEGEVT